MKKNILYLMAILLVANETFAQKFMQVAKITSDPSNVHITSRWIGRNLSIKNDVIIAGSSGEKAYPWTTGQPVYTPSWILTTNGTWAQADVYKAQRLTDVDFNDSENYNTWFGTSSATNGTVAVFGEPRYFENSAEPSMGSATVFELNGGVWQPKQRLLANDKAHSSSFGNSVAISDNQIFVGTKVYDAHALKEGAVYVFTKDGLGNWVQTQKLSSPITDDIYEKYVFGHHVAVSGDFLIVSNLRFAQVFKKKPDNSWEFHQRLAVPSPLFVNPIHTLSISNNYLVWGVNVNEDNDEAVVIFEKDANDVWQFKQKINDPDLARLTFYGTSVSISGDLLAVGSSSNALNENEQDPFASTGAVYLYERNASGNWLHKQKIVAFDRYAGNGFGHAVALDGNTLAVSSQLYFKNKHGVYNASTFYEGEIYIYKNAVEGNLPDLASESFMPGRVGEMLFTTPDLKPIVNIALTGALPLKNNLTTAKVWKQAAVQAHNSKLYLARNYEITPTNSVASSTGRITLYFNQQEFLDFNSNPSKTANFPINASDVEGIANLRILKISGSSSSDGSGLINTYGGTSLIINPDDDMIIWNAQANRWEVTFDVTGFSGFFATTEPTVLPVTLISFEAKKELDYVNLKWQTASESNNKGFEIYRSGDDKQFVQISEIPATLNFSLSTYHFADKEPLNGTNYYKLVQIDNDGKTTDLGVRSLAFSLSASNTLLYPNPALNKVNVTFESGKYQSLALSDNLGRTLQQQQIGAQTEQVVIDLTLYPTGVYFINLKAEGGNIVKKVIKQ